VKPPTAGQKKPTFAKPGRVLAPGQGGTIVMKTSCGAMVIQLDPKRGGPIPNSIAFLVQKRFYDGLDFHRVVPGFVLQAGDPNGDGRGGPGYTVTGAPPPGYRYRLGDVAMAKRQDEPPGAAGSQFFVISGPSGVALDPLYGILGHITDRASRATIARIAALAATDGPPRKPVWIYSARLGRG
jgi:cyclophilin family peptidyl-prolyl cis-trans isomerase